MLTPSWDRLRIIGNSRLIKLTIIMPLVGYIIIFNNHVVSALQLATDYFSSDIEHSLLGNINGEFLASRLRLLYFGLFLLGVGSSLFTLLCPQKVKQYVDAVALAQRELTLLPIPHFYSFVGDLSRKRNPHYTDIDIDEYRDRLATNEGESLEAVKIQIITEWYWSQNHRYPPIRWAAFLSFLVGFCLLSYPSITTLHKRSARYPLAPTTWEYPW
jgi:hypothetical protein